MAFNISNYRLKYYHTHTDQDGQIVRLEIWVKSTSVVRSKEIGELSGLSHEIQGQQDDVDAAIVKTSLHISMIDSYDIADTILVKHGNWSEFYTPDSTKYLVILKTMAAGATAYTTRWSGYVTPDSWQESLDYHGVVSITARDNMGHLQDFEFDAEGDDSGLISLSELVAIAADKVDFPMTIQWNSYDYLGQDWHMLKASDNTQMEYIKFNVEVFKDMNWYDVLETTLGDLGMVLRYVDHNGVVITPLRNLWLAGEGDEQATTPKQLVFFDGTKTLNPAYKSITDTINYDRHNDVEYEAKKGLSFTDAASSSYPFSVVYLDRSVETTMTGTGNYETLATPSANARGWIAAWGLRDKTRLVYATKTTSDYPTIDLDNVALLAANSTAAQPTYAQYRLGKINSMNCKLRIDLHPYGFGCNAVFASGAYSLKVVNAYLKSVRITIVFVTSNNSVTYYYDAANNMWVTSPAYVTKTFSDFTESIEFNLREASNSSVLADGTLMVELSRPVFYGKSSLFTSCTKGLYLGIKGITLNDEDEGVQSNKLTTEPEANTDYNIKNVKDCKVGPMSVEEVKWLCTKSYMNALYKDAYNMIPYNFKWDDGGGNTYPLPLLIHLERLAYHGTTKAIIEGDAKVSDGSGFAFNCRYKYKNVVYLLTSGTLDLITGRMNVTLYEYYTLV